MYADMIWKKGLEHFHFGNRWGYDIWGLEHCYLGVFKCFRIATIHPPYFPRKSRKSSSEMFQKSTTEQLREDMMWE